MKAAKMVSRAVGHSQRLAAAYPCIKTSFVIGVPMRIMTGPRLAVAVAVARASGLRFIGPGATPETTAVDLEAAAGLLGPSDALPTVGGALPVGVGFLVLGRRRRRGRRRRGQVPALRRLAVCAARRHGQAELNAWTARPRDAYADVRIWIQVGTVHEAVAVPPRAATLRTSSSSSSRAPRPRVQPPRPG